MIPELNFALYYEELATAKILHKLATRRKRSNEKDTAHTR